MARYADLTTAELEEELAQVRERYSEMQARGLALNMARGKPSAAQLELSLPMLDVLDSSANLSAEDGTDCRNYGVLDGIPEAKRLMATLLDDAPDNVIVLGNASLTAMYDAMARYMMFGALGSEPWGKLDAVKWLCPVPGYDRHFTICEALGIQMIPVPMDENGPVMDEVERLAAEDAAIKGIWCVPKYSNPSGVTYSDETVHRLAAMDCAAPDFRIFWDNAYAAHHFSDDPAEQDTVLDIAAACAEAGNPDRYLKFGSTSKITFPGAGVAAVAASPANVAEVKRHMNAQAIGHDKLNQLRHARFLKEGAGLAEHMAAHGALMKPKFDLVVEKLESELGEAAIATWTSPRGGYFVSFEGPEGTASRIVGLAREAGVTMTGAGATWPYGDDPADSNIRIAPSLPPLDELDAAMDVFCCCVKLAALEKLLED
ncbi:aminotransferase class I/II-fold pyridoxal phosphate-dependent enzyme [Adlercreutzia sp. R25]|uniref:Aminotransferase class I/II-fold pyridoxal phosphate-dependent enzyme n=1 Tax=Adlercreutzia shanghongiae TaxID=3111773 RepID=A0ABU6J1S7_9ACTN|nr:MULTISPECIES: aminotransferase class I/II-fold pyridoxal phosphate-dependent enzyme [unclassified Adlercreutzia]MEC4271599.1 aminotransferase class I/II-fold pyridoxal phosphate-dependent enzyme [Adlercreutzia sp. R25]MEC4295762.1 aminotransferase class I/II-fold pyridoxal phosphate-dependent enzyme [Adlercreutzia sp. R22]